MKTDNELIAEFMGVNKLHDSNGILWDTSQTGKEIYALRSEYLRYDSSWEWLMPVVNNIESIVAEPNASVMVGWDHWNNQFDGTINTDIIVAYQIVVEFIKWYNSQK